MAIKALDLNKTFPYVCADDDPDDPTTWMIGTLTSRDKGAIRDSATTFTFSNTSLKAAEGSGKGDEDDGNAKDGGTTTKIEKSKMNFEAVRRGVKGWENFLDGDGKPIPFKTVIRDVGGGVKKGVIPNDLMDRIPLNILDELAGIVMDGYSKDEEEDAGNSHGQSSVALSTPTENAPHAA